MQKEHVSVALSAVRIKLFGEANSVNTSRTFSRYQEYKNKTDNYLYGYYP